MKRFSFVCACLFTMLFLGWASAYIVNSIQFDRACGGHLKRAADANTVELAVKELVVAVSFLEREHMTSGYTSVLYQTPDEDIGFWFGNLSASLKELQGELTKEPAPSTLEKSNMLIKLRETLLDHESITMPSGISVFPNNALYMIWGWVSGLLACVGWIMFLIELERRNRW